MYDPLSSRRGRLATFFLLYVTEGLPQGFAATAVATQMRRQGLSPADVGLFVATLYLPWAWKWLFGPIVDLVYSERLGRRRGWIVGAQILMAATLLAAMPISFASQLALFTWVIVAHNVIAATQDVAIDALAVATLRADERGLANGLMFAGAYLGNAVGGSGALLLTAWVPFGWTFAFVAGAILLVTLGVSIWIREKRASAPGESDPTGVGVGADSEGASVSKKGSVVAAVRGYVVTVARAMFGTRAAVAGLGFALLPAGAIGLGLALQSNLAVELGLSDQQIAAMGFASAVLSATGCVVGGWLSDRWGRRRALAAFVLTTALPTLAMAVSLWRYGRVMPEAAPGGAALVGWFWAMTLAFALLHGLTYGTRTAFYMDLCDPRVGATQFTAYMAVLNLTIAYSAFWQGRAIQSWGYPATLAIDAILGLVGLALLPWCRRAVVPVDEAPKGGFEVVLSDSAGNGIVKRK